MWGNTNGVIRAILEIVTRTLKFITFIPKMYTLNSRKSVTWSAVPDAPMLVYVGMR